MLRRGASDLGAIFCTGLGLAVEVLWVEDVERTGSLATTGVVVVISFELVERWVRAFWLARAR